MKVDLPEQAYAAALASTQAVGPATLRTALAADRPREAWRKLCASHGATERDVLRVWQFHADRGIAVVLAGDEAYPERLRRDPHAPAVLFCVGDPLALQPPATVALVGTRAPTRYGIGVAAQFGADLAAAGVSVVSGLALGIDGAAHEGACGAGAAPIGVVAGGLDKPYPARHARLWQRVAECGAVVSESPAGVRTERWRFPVRNRLLAALSDVVIVVESRHHGGARHTVEAAATLGLPVGAVPGSIRSATSEGTNALLADGAFPACSTADILVALSLVGIHATPQARTEASGTGSERDRPGPGRDRAIYEALSSDPASLDDLVRITGLDLPALCGGLERLAQAGMAYDHGGWWERA
jgi:DNA processing protein